MTETFLHDVTVVELGDRLAVGLCGGLLQRLGADVIVVEPSDRATGPGTKWPHRALLGAGKRALSVDLVSTRDVERLDALLERADIVITSSDWQPRFPPRVERRLDSARVVCDVSAFGTSGPLAGARYTDAMMQAFAGLMDTTGMPDDEPVATRIPITECTAAVFAAAGVLAALRVGETEQRIEVAMFDTAVSMLSTFLPRHFIGDAPQRMGNRHPSMSPWNAYPARDAWFLLCSASDDMWGRVCDLVGRPELKDNPRFARMGGRVEHAAAADAALEPWIAQHSVDECVRAFNAASVPCGPVYDMAAVLADPNVVARGAVKRVEGLLVPGGLVHGSPAQGRAPEMPLVHDETPLTPSGREARAPASPSAASPLAGIRVLEMGSYTTAPLAARNLGALGAYVVKIEPPSGELCRAAPPYADGQSYLCTLSNSDKRCVALDLRTDDGRALFRTLLSKADVFVENMKPCVLDRFGFSAGDIASINPRLVYCSVSGYGAGSPFADLPAMDTTIQGTAGIMNLTRHRGVPYKTGISIADLLGGQFALLAILAALEYRSRTGKGQFIDLSMQELSAWLTQFEWNGEARVGGGRAVRCRDGYVYVEGDDARGDAAELARISRADAVARFGAMGVTCTPVNTVSEVASHAQTAARGLIVRRPSAAGRTWPLLASPIRSSTFTVEVRRAIGGVGEDLQEVLRDWGLC